MTYKVIPQVDFDKAVQRVLRIGVARAPAENIVLALWKAAQDLRQDFRMLIFQATSKGNLDVDQFILDHMNLMLPKTIQYNKKISVSSFTLVANELVYNEYLMVTEDDIELTTEADENYIAE